MAFIALRGKHAVGAHAFALVDDADAHWINEHSWKAKPNGSANNIYAVRNVIVDGKTLTVRMHREILGLPKGSVLEPDHINHNGLDNRRCNFRVVTRRENLQNIRDVDGFACMHCRAFTTRSIKANAAHSLCDACKAEREQRRMQASRIERPPYSVVRFADCMVCNQSFVSRKDGAVFCSDRCRCAAKNARIRAARLASGEWMLATFCNGRRATDGQRLMRCT